MTEEAGRPILKVVRGTPDEAELAALTAVVAGMAAAAAAEEAEQHSEWANRARLTRRSLQPGPGAWRSSGMPS
jgi:hypothetical protein